MKPRRLTIDGEVFVPVVLKITGSDQDGTPRELRLMHDDESTKIEGGEEFLIVYASARATARRS